MKLFLYRQWLMLLFCTVFIVRSSNAQQSVAGYVNNYIGSGSEGNTYPGAQAPFGMISVSPSNVFPDYDSAFARSGYKSSLTEIRGFGLTHFSGVGCHAMQDLLFMPVAGDLDKSPVNDRNAYKSSFSHNEEKCSPGWYQVRFKDYDVLAKFTATQRSGIGEITYNGSSKQNIVFEPTNSANGISAGELKIDAQHNRITGYITTGGFCWRDPALLPYTVYFVAEFDRPLSAYGTWKGASKLSGTDTVSGRDIAAYLTFNNGSHPVHMRTSISFVSVANAELNLKAEIPGWDIDKVYQHTLNAWDKYLNKITIDGATADQKATFYTAIYHNLLQPNIFDDVNGEYTGFDFKLHKIAKGHHKFVNFSLWDTYRTTAILQAMIAPDEASDMAQSLLLDAQQGGAFPNWSMNNQEYGVMNGYSTFPFIANLYAFGARNFDVTAVKDMMKKVSANYYGCQGRHGWLQIDDYKKLGYVPIEKDGFAVSMTEEYGIDDYAIAKMCGFADDHTAAQYYFHRSQNVFNLYNPASGYIQAKRSTGEFINGLNDTTTQGFNEGNAIQYLWMVPHSISKLIAVAGGKKVVEKRLDKFVSQIETGWAPDKPYYWIGNEPCFGAVYIYNYLQAPWKTQYNVRRIVTDYYNNSIEGLPGDDDVGAMSALYAFCAMGIYPYLPAEGGFTLSSPLFKHVTIHLKNGRQINIIANKADAATPYIQSLTINGKTTNQLWVNWADLNKGAVLNFKLGNKPNKSWGSSLKDTPPSYASE